MQKVCERGRKGKESIRPQLVVKSTRTEYDGVGFVDEAFPFVFVLALVGVNRQNLQIVASLQPLPDLQSRRPGFSINEDLGLGEQCRTAGDRV